MRYTCILSRLIGSLLLAQAAEAQLLQLPMRPTDAPSREQIIQTLIPLSRESREETLLNLIMAGDVPEFMRRLVPVTSTGSVGGIQWSVTFYVTPDYLAVGSDTSYLLIPMTPLLAQRLADTLQCTLPTRKMVNDIYASAALKLAPAPIPPSPDMVTVPVFARHDSMVWAQRAPQLPPFPLGTLVGGSKKDVVISNKIRTDLKPGVPRPVVIYGWHQLNGQPIQPLYNGHGETYADYSHGIRLVQQVVGLNGSPTTISAILKSDTLASILSDEGVIPVPRYGEAVTGVDLVPVAKPQGSLILQSFPNPFNSSTEIRFQLPSASFVTVKVYDILGREAAVLVDEQKEKGDYETRFDAAGLSSGVYVCRLTAGNTTLARTIIFAK